MCRENPLHPRLDFGARWQESNLSQRPLPRSSQYQDFDEAVRIAQSEFDQHQPDVIVGSSRGGAVALNIDSKDTQGVRFTPLNGSSYLKMAEIAFLHSRADNVVPFTDSEELVGNSGLPSDALIEVGNDHRLADPDPLEKMVDACEGAA